MRIFHLLLCAASHCIGSVLDADELNPSPAVRAALENSTASALNASSNSLKMRRVTTSVAGATALWTAVTYFFVIYHGSSLAQGLALPLRSFKRSLATLLARAWVPHLVTPLNPQGNSRLKVVRLQKNQHVAEPSLAASTEDAEEDANPVTVTEEGSKPKETFSQKAQFALGNQELEERAPSEEEASDYQGAKNARQVWFHPASSAMKNIIISAIWEWWSFWMIIAMVLLTAIYNGFFWGPRGPDAVVRLVLVCLYAGIHLAHMVAFWVYFRDILDAVGNQVCWSTISKTFLFFSNSDHADALYEFDFEYYEAEGLDDGLGYRYFWSKEKPLYLRKFDCELLGTIKTAEIYRSCNNQSWRGNKAEFDPADGFGQNDITNFEPVYSNPRVFHKDDAKIKTNAEDALKLMIDMEVKALEKAAESGLEKLLANGIVILGICLSTGLAPWTTIRSQESVATQIGSYAIILAVSTGVTSLIASLTNMSNVAHSTRMLMRFQHYILGLSKDQYEKGVVARHARYGMKESPGPEIASMIGLVDLFSSTRGVWRRILWIFWGPALGLMPHSRDDPMLVWFLKLPFRFLRWAFYGIVQVPRDYRSSDDEAAAEPFLPGRHDDQAAIQFEIRDLPPATDDLLPTTPTASQGIVASAHGSSASRNSLADNIHTAPAANDDPATSPTTLPVASDAGPVQQEAAAAPADDPNANPGAPSTTQGTPTYSYSLFQIDMVKGDLFKVAPVIVEDTGTAQDESAIPQTSAAGSVADQQDNIPLQNLPTQPASARPPASPISVEEGPRMSGALPAPGVRD